MKEAWLAAYESGRAAGMSDGDAIRTAPERISQLSIPIHSTSVEIGLRLMQRRAGLAYSNALSDYIEEGGTATHFRRALELLFAACDEQNVMPRDAYREGRR